MTKMFIFLVITINGLLLNTFVSPKLTEIDFKNYNKQSFIAFCMGIVSLVSWFLAFLLGRLKFIPLTFLEGIIFYFIIILISITIGIFIFKSKLKII
jgi:hypothetical protein